MAKEGLCYRCEHRAKALETGSGPRHECKTFDMCVIGCYMYQPVRPVILKKRKGDKRPEFGPWMISARSEYVKTADEIECAIRKCKEGNMIFWRPKRKKKEKSE